MKPFNLNRNLAQLALLQRIELADDKLKKVRKIFGRYLFSKFFSKYLIDVQKISENYLDVMIKELDTINKFVIGKKFFLSIGAGIGGLELLILRSITNSHISFIEKDYVSNKVKYGWDNLNREAYNNLNQLNFFSKVMKYQKNDIKYLTLIKKIFQQISLI